MTDFHQLESLAREICDSRNGAGHYDAKGTKRAYWLTLAIAEERERGIGLADAFMAIFGMKRVKE